MVAQLLQPSRDVLVCLVLANVVDKQRTNGASIVCRCDSSITLLACCIPDLCLDRLRVHLDGSRSEFNTDGRLRVKIELVPCESTQQVGLADAGITNEDD